MVKKLMKKSKKSKKKLKIKAIFSVFTGLILVVIIFQVVQGKSIENRQGNETGKTSDVTTEQIISNIDDLKEVEKNNGDLIVDSNLIQEDSQTYIQIKEEIEDQEIKQLMEKFITENKLTEDNFAFFYYNIKEERYYFYNETKYFTAASTAKVPVAMLYYDMINEGEISEKTKIKYKETCYEEGGGSTAATYSAGEFIPVNYLLKQSIINSDNTAVNILINNIGWTKYRYDMTKYTDEIVPEEFYKNNLISAAYGYDLINYIYENQEKYQELVEYMKQSSNGEYLKKYLKCDVAHKYGSYSGYVHDYGIVFSENSDYLIGVFTKNISNANELIAEMSLKVYETKI